MKNQEIIENGSNWGFKAETLCNAYIDWQSMQSPKQQSARQKDIQSSGR